MSFCKKCGTNLSDTARFCKECGAPVEHTSCNPTQADNTTAHASNAAKQTNSSVDENGSSASGWSNSKKAGVAIAILVCLALCVGAILAFTSNPLNSNANSTWYSTEQSSNGKYYYTYKLEIQDDSYFVSSLRKDGTWNMYSSGEFKNNNGSYVFTQINPIGKGKISSDGKSLKVEGASSAEVVKTWYKSIEEANKAIGA